ncbi:hypothetical protein AUP68_06529 [Ilyonectria robusta]
MSQYPYHQDFIHIPVVGGASQPANIYFTAPLPHEPIERFQWEPAGLQAKPTILFGLAPLDGGTEELQRNARASIAWVQPTPAAGMTWDLGMPAECAALCATIERDRRFRHVRMTKQPGVYQLEPGGIIWVESGFLGLCVLLQERDANVQLVSYKKQSLCNCIWPVGHILYLTATGIQSEQRIKLALLLFKVEPYQL